MADLCCVVGRLAWLVYRHYGMYQSILRTRKKDGGRELFIGGEWSVL